MIGKLLLNEEGFRTDAYYCSEGYPTIGIGKRIGSKGASLDNYRFTCPLVVAIDWLEEETDALTKQLSKYSWFTKQNKDRQTILISMAYQMGMSGLLCFQNMIRALEAGEFEQAEVEALDSRWYRQTPKRAKRHAEVLKTGDLDYTYPELGVK